MKLPARVRHGVRLTLEVYRGGGERRPVALSEVAANTGLSTTYLGQLVLALKSHSLLRGVCGRRGGYLLGRPAEEMTIGDVVEAVSGPIELAVCAGDAPVCMSSEFCECQLVWQVLQRQIRQVLHSCTIADLADEDWLRAVRAELAAPAAAPESDRPVGLAWTAAALAMLPQTI